MTRTCSWTRQDTTNAAATTASLRRFLGRKPSDLLRQGWEYPWKTLWKGIVPSLLLCSNPAINYTVFDVVKSRVLFLRQRKTAASHDPELSDNRHLLTLMEAFLIGLCSKFLSTIITYPLIRAKVKLMVHAGDNDSDESSTTLWAWLCREFQQHGVVGLYKGCNWQLLHTLLKSALLMMLRERIEGTTRRWLVSSSDESERR